MVFGANTYREFASMLAEADTYPDVLDPWVTAMRNCPATVVSSSLSDPLDWPDAVVAAGDALELVQKMKQDSDVPIRSHGSLSLNRALMKAGLVDRLQVTLYPVITGRTGAQPIFAGAEDFDLELLDRTSLGNGIEELVYRPTLH